MIIYLEYEIMENDDMIIWFSDVRIRIYINSYHTIDQEILNTHTDSREVNDIMINILDKMNLKVMKINSGIF